MLRGVTLPGTLSCVLDPLRRCFTVPTFETCSALVAGLVAQPMARTVYGMLTGAGLAPCSGAPVFLLGAVVSAPGGAGGGRGGGGSSAASRGAGLGRGR